MSTRQLNIAFGVLFGLFFIANLALSERVTTGDEPRYIFYTASFWYNRTFAMPLDVWQKVSGKYLTYSMARYPVSGGGTMLSHPVFLGMFLSPASVFGIIGLRLTGLIAGCGGILAVYFTTRRLFGTWVAFVSAASAATTFPLLPYIYTYWIEVFIFAALAVALYQLPSGGKSLRSDLWRSMIILIIPFVHLRPAVIAAAVFVLFLLRVAQQTHWNIRRIAPLVVLAGAMAALLLVLNYWIYGSVIGSVTSARPPSLDNLFMVFATNLVSIKGALPYAPIWLLGFAGLIAGLLKRDRFIAECFLLLLVGIATSIGVNPGEGWPGRFSVVWVPLLSVGLAYWVNRTHAFWSARVLFVLLLGISLLHTTIFFVKPNLHIASRQSDTVYELLFSKFGFLNPGLYLPVEGIGTYYTFYFMCGAILLMLLFSVAALFKSRVAMIASVVAVLGLLEATRVAVAPAEIVLQDKETTFVFDEPTNLATVSVGARNERWIVPPKIPVLTSRIVLSGVAKSAVSELANPITTRFCSSPYEGIVVSSVNFDIRSASSFDARAYRSTSLILRALAGLHRSC